MVTVLLLLRQLPAKVVAGEPGAAVPERWHRAAALPLLFQLRWINNRAAVSPAKYKNLGFGTLLQRWQPGMEEAMGPALTVRLSVPEGLRGGHGWARGLPGAARTPLPGPPSLPTSHSFPCSYLIMKIRKGVSKGFSVGQPALLSASGHLTGVSPQENVHPIHKTSIPISPKGKSPLGNAVLELLRVRLVLGHSGTKGPRVWGRGSQAPTAVMP